MRYITENMKITLVDVKRIQEQRKTGVEISEKNNSQEHSDEKNKLV